MRVILIAFPLFSFYFTREALPHRGLLHTIFCIAYLRICRGYLRGEFAVGICRRNLPWVFCIYMRILFRIMSKSCLYGSKPFVQPCVQNFLICEIFFINSVSSCYCRGSYGPLYIQGMCRLIFLNFH